MSADCQGGHPVRHTNMMIPICQQSEVSLHSYLSLVTRSHISGGKNGCHVHLCFVTKVPSRTVAPKSQSLTRDMSAANTRMFSNFKSRCTNFRECRNPTADASCSATLLQYNSGNPPALTNPERSPSGACS